MTPPPRDRGLEGRPRRVLVYEHVAGGGLAGERLRGSLRVQGLAMLEAFISDLGRIPGVRVLTTIDGRLVRRAARWPARVLPARRPGDARRHLLEHAATADGVLLIAPETGGLLESLTRDVVAAGGRLLGPSPEAVATCADKLALARALEARGVPVVCTRPVSDAEPGHRPLVLKPRDGAGSEGIRVWRPGSPRPRIPPPAVATELVPGIAASALVLRGVRRSVVLPPGRQILSTDGRLRWTGGEAPLPPPLARRAAGLARAAAGAIDGLHGLAGVDLVLASEPREEDRVVEVNPRPCTSWVGLRRLARGNLAHTWLSTWDPDGPEAPRWKHGTVRFGDDGGPCRGRPDRRRSSVPSPPGRDPSARPRFVSVAVQAVP